MYQQTRLSDLSAIGAPGPVPYCVANWADAELADLDAVGLDPQFGLAGMGIWPVVVSAASYDATRQVLTGGVTSLAVDAAAKRWTATQAVRDLTADELAAALAAAQAAKTQAIGAKLAGVLAAGAPATGGLHIALDDGSRADMGGVATTALGAVSGAVPWPDDYKRGFITIENSRIPLATPADGLALAAGVGAYYATVRQHARDLKDAVLAAVDQATLAAIDIDAGWP